MDRTIRAATDAPVDRLHEVVADLTSYPSWLSLVNRVTPDEAAPGDTGPAFLVTLRAKVGPFARNKRLRMVRTAHESPTMVRFERVERDGRNHSSWVMTSEVAPTTDGSEVAVRLIYQGQMWDSLLASVLDGAVADAVPRLQAEVAARRSEGQG